MSFSVIVNNKKYKFALSYVIYLKYGDNWQAEILSPQIKTKTVSSHLNGKKLTLVVVRYADKLGKLSPYKALSVAN